MTLPRWHLEVAVSADGSLGQLPTKVAMAVVEFMLGPLTDEPKRVGHPLQRELTGYWSARRGAYRTVYELDNGERVINVVRINHSANIYRRK